ncbi:uncharacterized protein LOC135941909 isoform X2 [Cloeon dipterum]|uniref:uncharacterized protein LOC135941909 isoform X2 n=1 Tax=Cloeon dipterum TaxID=197152 RepID=UPI0032206FED
MESSQVTSQTTMSPETPPPSPPNEQQTEAKIEYTDASTIRMNKDRLYKRRPASTELDDSLVPPVEFREPVDVITKAPCMRNSSLDGHELESWNWDRVSCGTGIFMWEREWEYYIPQEEKRFFKKRLITSALDDVDAIGCPAHELDERSTGESDAHSAGTASAKSMHGLIDKKFDDDEPQGALYNMMISCCTCLGIFCFT